MVPALPISETEGFGKIALGLLELLIVTPMTLPWNLLKYLLYSHILDDWLYEIPKNIPNHTPIQHIKISVLSISTRFPLNKGSFVRDSQPLASPSLRKSAGHQEVAEVQAEAENVAIVTSAEMVAPS